MKGNLSLMLAQNLSERVNQDFESGKMFNSISDITHRLLDYWFGTTFTDIRTTNFHAGQKQSILNVIYLHEVLKVTSVYDIYNKVVPELLGESDLLGTHSSSHTLTEESFDFPKYLIKMATGTGKTWVMHALLIWQILNRRHEQEQSDRFSNNFLIIAPGIIVYERLLDAYKGKLNEENGTRDFTTSDIVRQSELFLPEEYRQEIFAFLQNNIVSKEEGIGQKVTDGGLIALTNWHLFLSNKDEKSSIKDINLIDDLLPARPGTTAGNNLDNLDAKYLRGTAVEYLQSLPDLVIINDEAHHIHNNDLQWQQGLNKIISGKNKQRVQVDFSATPYTTSGNGENERKDYFPHIVSNFTLNEALNKGLVKMISLDRRQELTKLEDLDFLSVRDERGRFISLSDGQKMMLKAGLTKLDILEQGFGHTGKYPKMLVLCEDTIVAQAVVEFLTSVDCCGMHQDDVARIDSDKKGDIKESKWKEVKEKLFNIDKHSQPKVIVSVLMLREGFDVNNVCVIVPLRSTQSNILLEQIVGRGLRLMFREPEYQETKLEIKEALLRNENPNAYYDILFIIEHPRFITFWENLKNEGIFVGGIDENKPKDGKITGDIITVELKENYEKYDMYIPKIMNDGDEELSFENIDVCTLKPFETYSLQQLQKLLAPNKGEIFTSQAIISKGQWGKYAVDVNLFNAKSYNIYLQRLVNNVGKINLGGNRNNIVQGMQSFQGEIITIADKYIRTRLFSEEFNPYENNNWKILLSADGCVSSHILSVLNKLIFDMQRSTIKKNTLSEKVWFSSVPSLKMRENYSFEVIKTIYKRFGYPSRSGGYERQFGEFLDNDSKVKSFLKIDEHKHLFARIPYLREDGMLAWYSPDFIVKTDKYIYIIETKAAANMTQANVLAKKLSAVEWCKKINNLNQEDRMFGEWKYILLSEKIFHSLLHTGADIENICERAKLSESNTKGELTFE